MNIKGNNKSPSRNLYDFSRTDFKSMEELRGNLVNRNWPGIESCADILFGLTVCLKAKLIFEIGTGGLWSTQCFLHGLEITDGKIVSCDIIKRFKDFSHPRLQFINKPSYEIAKTWKLPIDILFIDGYHQKEAVKQDYELFSPFVEPKKLIIFHDTNHPVFPGARKVVKEIQGPKIVFEEYPGLTILQKVI